jgi:hypothetical protein
MVLLVPPRGAAQSQVVNQNNGPGRSQDMPQADVALEIKGTVKVTIQADKTRGFMAPRALGMASSAADNHLTDPLMPQILQSAGVSTLRYPGGSYSDHNHWSTYKPTKLQESDPPQYAYYAAGNNFGHFVGLSG